MMVIKLSHYILVAPENRSFYEKAGSSEWFWKNISFPGSKKIFIKVQNSSDVLLYSISITFHYLFCSQNYVKTMAVGYKNAKIKYKLSNPKYFGGNSVYFWRLNFSKCI